MVLEAGSFSIVGFSGRALFPVMFSLGLSLEYAEKDLVSSSYKSVNPNMEFRPYDLI